MAKPGSVLTHSTLLNFTAGPAAGQPTKVTIPIAAEGFIPGEETIPEYLNDILNFIGTWITWQFDGSFTGAADAHVVETDASGRTIIGRISEGSLNSRYEFDAGVFPANYPFITAGFGSTALLAATGIQVIISTTGAGAGEPTRFSHSSPGNVNRARSYVFEIICRITTSIANVQFEFGPRDTVDTPIEGGVTGCAVVFNTTLGDANWTLVGASGAATTRSASSTVVVLGTFYKLRVEVAMDGSAELFVDGVGEATLAAAVVGSAESRFEMHLDNVGVAAIRTAEHQRIQWWQDPSA